MSSRPRNRRFFFSKSDQGSSMYPLVCQIRAEADDVLEDLPDGLWSMASRRIALEEAFAEESELSWGDRIGHFFVEKIGA